MFAILKTYQISNDSKDEPNSDMDSDDMSIVDEHVQTPPDMPDNDVERFKSITKRT